MKNLEFDHLIRELKKSNAPIVIFGTKKIGSLTYYALKNEDGSGYGMQTNIQVMDVSSERFLRFGSINRTAKGDYTNYSIGANLDYSFKKLSFSTLDVDSKINISYQYNHQSSNKNQMCNLSKKYVEIKKGAQCTPF